MEGDKMPKRTFFRLPPAKQTQIIESAIHIFSSRDYSKVTIDAIVEQAQIPKGSFYQYFENKNDLYTYIFEGITVDKKDMLESILLDSDKYTFSEMIVIMLNRADNFENQTNHMKALKNKFLNQCPQDLKQSILVKMVPDTMALFQTIIKAYQNKGELSHLIDTKLLAFMLTSTSINLSLYPLEDGQTYEQILLDACNLIPKIK